MSDTERFAAMSADLEDIDRRIDAMLAERNALIAENEALRERLRGSPAMREVVGELRRILPNMPGGWAVTEQLASLLRRIDLESQQPTETK